jgi:SAM-dependent methyltransferase
MNISFLSIYNFFAKIFLNPLLVKEQKKRPFPLINERPMEYSFTLNHMKNLCLGKVLDIGSGRSSWPHLLSTCGYDVTAIDKKDGYWNSFFNRHYLIQHGDIVNSPINVKAQFITCLSVLEHIPEHKKAVINMNNILLKDGYLILTFPYNEKEYHPNIYSHPDAGYGKKANFITQVFSRQEINEWVKATGLTIVDQSYYQIFTGKFWTFGERILPGKSVDKSELHHLTCILFRKG